MCTLTLVPLGGGCARLASNRDEQRARPPALPPQRRRFGRHTAILPVDSVWGGTWIGVNDAGLALALLNVNLPHGSSRPRAIRASRGAVIPELLGCGTLAAALRRARRLRPEEYAPFRLVLLARGEVAEVRWDGANFRPTRHGRLTAPLLFTSSGLGDHLVEGPRRRLFEEFFARPGDWPARQDAFHRHSWPGREHLSVCMRRADACTVSHTLLEIDESSCVLTYNPAAPDRPAMPALARLLFPEVPVRCPS
jgi:hypothetical protein